jgi:hypothetical protein
VPPTTREAEKVGSQQGDEEGVLPAGTH